MTKKDRKKKKETKLPAITHGPDIKLTELSVSSKILKPITNL